MSALLKSPWIGSFILFLVTCLVRLPYIESRSVWYNEASSWQTASFPLADFYHSLSHNVHLPLFYLLLKPWLLIFGSSATALRLFSVFFAGLTAIGLHRLARQFYLHCDIGKEACITRDNERTTCDCASNMWRETFAITIVGLYMFSPFQVFNGIEARMYTMGSAFFVWGCHYCLLVRENAGTWNNGMLFIFCCTLALYSHHYLLLSVSILFIVGMLAIRPFRTATTTATASTRLDLRRRRWIICVTTVTVLYFPMFIILAFQRAKIDGNYWIEPISFAKLQATLIHFVAPGISTNGTQKWMLTVLLLAACSILARHIKSGEAACLALGIGPMIGAALASQSTPIWHHRYFVFAHLALLFIPVLITFRATPRCPSIRCILIAFLLIANIGLNLACWGARPDIGEVGMKTIVSRIESQGDGPCMILTRDFRYFVTIKFYTSKTCLSVRYIGPEDEGMHLLRPHDFLSQGECAEISKRGFWLVHALGDPVAMRPPLDQLPVAESFEINYYHGPAQHRLVAAHYLHPASLKSPPGDSRRTAQHVAPGQ